MKKEDLPINIPIFPLSNFIIFPKTTVPLNIFEPRYIQMIDDSMKTHRMIGMVQPKKTGELMKPDLYNVNFILERAMGLEPTTFSLATRRSTTELCPHLNKNIIDMGL